MDDSSVIRKAIRARVERVISDRENEARRLVCVPPHTDEPAEPAEQEDRLARVLDVIEHLRWQLAQFDATPTGWEAALHRNMRAVVLTALEIQRSENLNVSSVLDELDQLIERWTDPVECDNLDIIFRIWMLEESKRMIREICSMRLLAPPTPDRRD